MTKQAFTSPCEDNPHTRSAASTIRAWGDRHVIILVAAALILVPAPVVAAEGEYVYFARPGDTLIGIGEQLLKRPSDWLHVQRLNRVSNPRRIPIGTALRIPVSLMHADPASARITNLVGDVRSANASVAPGAVLAERSELETGDDGYVTVELADGSKLTLQPRSRMRLESLKRYRNTDAYDSRLDLGSGRVETNAAPQNKGAGRHEVRTPSAVIGVRGTQFRSSIDDKGVSRGEVTEGVVTAAKADRLKASTSVRAGYGIVIDRDKPLAAPVALLAAPDLSAVPSLQERVTMRFAFPAVDGALSYRGQVAKDQEFRDVLAEGVFTAAEAKFAGLPDGDYWLRVRGIDARGLEGRDAMQSFRLKARPEPPFLSQPGNQGKVRSDTVEFRWTASAEASSYLFALAPGQDFGRITYEASGVAQTTLTTPESLEPGEYFWRVASVRENGERGPWGDVQRFTLKPAPANPDPPRLDDKQLTFSWSAEPEQTFEFELARDERFANRLVTERLDSPTITMPRPEPGTYFMRVRATDPDGFVGPYTATQRVEVPEPPPWWWLVFLVPLL